LYFGCGPVRKGVTDGYCYHRYGLKCLNFFLETEEKELNRCYKKTRYAMREPDAILQSDHQDRRTGVSSPQEKGERVVWIFYIAERGTGALMTRE